MRQQAGRKGWTTLFLRLKSTDRQRLENVAKATGKDLSALGRDAITSYLDAAEKFLPEIPKPEQKAENDSMG